MKPNQPIKIEQKYVDCLQNRIGDEYTAFYFYRNAANYLEDLGYTSASSYFSTEAEHELEHAKGVQKFLVDWNVKPKLPPIETPTEFEGLVDVINKAYDIEYDLLEAYKEDASEAIKGGNIEIFNFLQGYVNIQNESVAEYATLLNKLALIDTEDKSWLYDFQREEFEA